MALKLSPLRGSPSFSYIPAIAAPWKGAHIEAEQDLMPAKKNHVKVSVRQPIKKISRVPRYQNSQEVVGFCDFLVKFLARSALPLATKGTQERLARNLRSGSKPLLTKKGLGLMEDAGLALQKKTLLWHAFCISNARNKSFF